MEEFWQKIGVGIRPIDDHFFDDSYRVCKVFQRKGILVEDDEELCHEIIKEFPCSVPGCIVTFKTLLDYEMHYNGSHRYVCLQCKKVKPSPRLLDIHIQEKHDSFFKVLAERQPMHQCYVSECELKFANPGERRDHCVTVHKFPKNFRFEETPKHVSKEKSKDEMEVDRQETRVEKPVRLNKNQRAKTFQPVVRNITNNESSGNCDLKPSGELKKASSLVFVPRQVLRKSYSKALTNDQHLERNVLESKTLMDLAESLAE